jgi:flagellar basal-body rod protein FlgC
MPTLYGAMNASASGLDAQRTRIEVAVSNLANAESTRGPNGEPYRRRDVVLQSTEAEAFESALGQAGAVGVQVAEVVVDQSPFRTVYEPSHPDADTDGFIKVPNVSVPEEMVQVLGAARAYQANITAIGLIRDTVQKALEIAR